MTEELRRAAPALGLATGSSIELVYAELAHRVVADSALRAGAERARAFALDEYLDLPQGDEHSYRRTLERQFAEPIGFFRERLHMPRADAFEPPERFERAICDLGGVGLQLLGIGANGHLGFNEPGSPLDSRTRIVDLAPRTRADNARFFADSGAVPTQAVTQGIGTILDARALVVLAFGAQKAPALAAALLGPLTPEVPSSALRLHGDVTIFADEAAAAGLTELGHGQRERDGHSSSPADAALRD